MRSDLDVILEQIIQAEQNLPLPNLQVPFGLRTLDGSGNNLVQARGEFGAADNTFPRTLTEPEFPEVITC